MCSTIKYIVQWYYETMLVYRARMMQWDFRMWGFYLSLCPQLVPHLSVMWSHYNLWRTFHMIVSQGNVILWSRLKSGVDCWAKSCLLHRAQMFCTTHYNSMPCHLLLVTSLFEILSWGEAQFQKWDLQLEVVTPQKTNWEKMVVSYEIYVARAPQPCREVSKASNVFALGTSSNFPRSCRQMKQEVHFTADNAAKVSYLENMPDHYFLLSNDQVFTS